MKIFSSRISATKTSKRFVNLFKRAFVHSWKFFLKISDFSLVFTPPIECNHVRMDALGMKIDFCVSMKLWKGNSMTSEILCNKTVLSVNNAIYLFALILRGLAINHFRFFFLWPATLFYLFKVHKANSFII